MLVYYPEMVGAIDLVKEDARLSKVEFNKEAPTGAAVKVAAPSPPPPPTGAAKTLNDAEDLYRARSLDQAKKLYLDVLQQTDQKPMHASAYYGLARIAALQKDPETAERLFQKALELQPEAQVKAWTLVYLGKLAMAASEKDQAAKYFQEALKVDGASDAARKEAQRSLEQYSKQ